MKVLVQQCEFPKERSQEELYYLPFRPDHSTLPAPSKSRRIGLQRMMGRQGSSRGWGWCRDVCVQQGQGLEVARL